MKVQYSGIRFPGITPDTLGGYLCGLGLLSACTELDSSLRGCWRDEVFELLSESAKSFEDIEQYLRESWSPPRYPATGASAGKKLTQKTAWSEEQKEDTKKKDASALRKFRSDCSADEARFLDSHIVSVRRNVFNPITGTGGNVGKRNLAKVALDATALLHQPGSRGWLCKTLCGEQVDLPELQSTGTWFTHANKTYNSGQGGFFREGRISPWSFLLALKGALLLQGSIGRRLSAKSRPYAAFPFIAEAANPTADASVGIKRMGEFWAPIWDRPASLVEVRALLKRGLVRIGNKAATAPHEFAVAALGAGLDAGVVEFVPFELRETTSGQVYEAIPRNRVTVRHDEFGHRASELLAALIPWISRLPWEPRDAKQRGKFAGLRGSVEQAILAVSEQPENPESWRTLLLAVTESQTHIDVDRTRHWRERCIPLPRLSTAWLDYLWPTGRSDEIEIACALASIGAMSDRPLLTNVFGVNVKEGGAPWFPKERPASAIWIEGDAIVLMADILHRRLVGSAERENGAPWPLGASYLAPLGLLEKFLAGATDDEEIARWIPALSLLDWRRAPKAPRFSYHPVRDGLLHLDGLIRPLLTSGMTWSEGKLISPTAGVVLRILALLRQGDIESAVEFACMRYRALGLAPVQPDAIVASRETLDRLAAGLLIPLGRAAVEDGRRRWVLNT